MIKIAKNDSEFNNEENEKNSNEDLLDIELLKTRAMAQIIMVYSYLFDYASTLQEIKEIENENFFEEYERETDPDILAILAAKYGLIGRTILTKTSEIQFSRLEEHYRRGVLNAVRSANFELYISDVLEQLAYGYNLVGVVELYKIKKYIKFQKDK